MSNIVVTDNIAGVNPVYVGGDVHIDGKLDLTEIWTYSATGIATVGQYVNIGMVEGTPPVGPNVTDEDPSHYIGSNPPLLSALGDTVWFDANKNGIQDGLGTPDGEKGVEGVVVNLYTSGGVFVATDITYADGKYLFVELQPGSYYVEFAKVEGYSFTHYTVGSNETDNNALMPWVDYSISTNLEEADVGQPLTYTIFYTNTDATRDATNVVISIIIPAGTTYAGDAANPGWQCSSPNPGGVCTLTLATILANSSGSARFVIVLNSDRETVPDQLDVLISITQGTLARTDVVTLAPGETNLTVDAGLVILGVTLSTPTQIPPTNLPGGKQPQQRQYMFLPAVES